MPQPARSAPVGDFLDCPVEPGECTLTVHYDGPDDPVGRVYVDQADPVVWAAGEAVAEIKSGAAHPDVTIQDDLITIRGSNRTVVYRIRQDDFPRDRYLMVWPD